MTYSPLSNQQEHNLMLEEEERYEQMMELSRQQGRIDEATGLPLNEDGTVTSTTTPTRKTAEGIKSSRELRSAGEPDVYVTTRAIADTGYGDTAVAIESTLLDLSLADEFPNGRKDFRLQMLEKSISGGIIQVKVESLHSNKILTVLEVDLNQDTLTALFTKQADFSTFAHETAHYMLTVLENIVTTENAPLELINDFNILLDFGVLKI